MTPPLPPACSDCRPPLIGHPVVVLSDSAPHLERTACFRLLAPTHLKICRQSPLTFEFWPNSPRHFVYAGVKTRADLLKIPPGREGRKYLHDDITVSVRWTRPAALSSGLPCSPSSPPPSVQSPSPNLPSPRTLFFSPLPSHPSFCVAGGGASLVCVSSRACRVLSCAVCCGRAQVIVAPAGHHLKDGQDAAAWLGWRRARGGDTEAKGEGTLVRNTTAAPAVSTLPATAAAAAAAAAASGRLEWS